MIDTKKDEMYTLGITFNDVKDVDSVNPLMGCDDFGSTAPSDYAHRVFL